tara:strand:+ start:1031 stop:1294 length:264 start_codon:yes stop_codon:yes gene_type:complete
MINLDSVSGKIPNRNNKNDSSNLKTGNKRSYNMPSPKKCATEWKKLGYSSMSDCVSYGDEKETMVDMDKPKSKKMKSKSPMKSRMAY